MQLTCPFFVPVLSSTTRVLRGVSRHDLRETSVFLFLLFILLHAMSAVVTNSLLATLNSRQVLKGGGSRDGDPSMTDDTTTSIPLGTPVRTVLTGLYAVSDWVLFLAYLVDCSLTCCYARPSLKVLEMTLRYMFCVVKISR